MEGMSTALRAFFSRRLDLTAVASYALLLGSVIVVLILGGMIIATQLRGL